jgi:hypothetical protein
VKLQPPNIQAVLLFSHFSLKDSDVPIVPSLVHNNSFDHTQKPHIEFFCKTPIITPSRSILLQIDLADLLHDVVPHAFREQFTNLIQTVNASWNPSDGVWRPIRPTFALE